jgi:hypothetical protein
MIGKIRSDLNHVCLTLIGAVVATLLFRIDPALGQTTAPDPTLLPVATTAQAPLTGAYGALNVPGIAAGGFYLDPTTGVKIYKLTSSVFPAPSSSWGHDYAEGGDEVSLPYRPDGITRAVLVRQNGLSGGPWWLIDFTPGVGIGNPRQLVAPLAPWIDLTFAFSNNPATPWYAYVAHGNTIRRIDIRTMTEAPGGGWPVVDQSPTWLHQSENDGFFVWMRCPLGDCSMANTVVGYEPGTGALKARADPEMNEPRIDRAGRYVAMVVCPPGVCGISVWDWQTDSILWEQRSGNSPNVPFTHNSSLRRRWVVVDTNLSWPGEFAKFVPDVPNSQARLGGPANGTLIHGSGNWIQHPLDLDDQWSVFLHYGSLQPTGASWLAPGGMVFMTPNGGRRLLGHPYNTTGTYNYFSFAKPSSDGKYVLFTSDMNGSGRSDVFLAEVPTRAATGSVFWTNLVNATATGNSLEKTSGCDGCPDAGATSRQQIDSGDGYIEFTVGTQMIFSAVGLSRPNTDASVEGIDFALRFSSGFADVLENGAYKGGDSTYVSGDVFRVSVAGGQVQYRKNGQLLRTSDRAPIYPLLLDATLGDLGDKIDNAVISPAP